MQIRFATSADLAVVIEIYNQAIRAGGATAYSKEITIEDRKDWFEAHHPDTYPLYILEIEGEVAGWGSLSSYRGGRGALAALAEISYYLDYDYHRQGLGRKLMEHIMKDCPRLGFKHLIALLMEVNTGSIAILKKMGFAEWGYLPDVVQLPDGRTCAHLIYGKTL